MDQGSYVIIRNLGHVAYLTAWRGMQEFTRKRHPATADEIWLLSHPPVYTIGLKGKQRAFVSPQGIPFVRSDRGGDMTYHGPGQVVAYVLMDLYRRGWGVKQLVHGLEQAVIDLLGTQAIRAHRRNGAPGVYVNDKKIAALGLRVRRGQSYHGLALNVDMDLQPFEAIDPCGYPGLDVTQLADLGVRVSAEQAVQLLVPHLTRSLGYNAFRFYVEQHAERPVSSNHG